VKLSDYEYFRTDLGVLYCGDCLEILPLIDKVDLVLTDPPYGININSNGFIGGDTKLASKTNFQPTKWDKSKIDINKILKIGLNHIIWGGNYYKLPETNSWIIWDKKDKNNWDDTFSDGEMAWTSFKRPLKIFRCRSIGMHWDKKRDGSRLHPTQKPIRLILWILEKYDNDSKLILDPFLGSGTTAVACEKLGRRWIGIEISEKYCEIAKQRIKAEADQFKLEYQEDKI
jgi:DNA modification methylase